MTKSIQRPRGITFLRNESTPTAALEHFFTSFLYPNLSPQQVASMRQHLEWIKRQPRSAVKVQVETIPQLHVTKISLEISHSSLS